MDWAKRVAYHEREMQGIKKILREQHGGVFDSYAGGGHPSLVASAVSANKLRAELEKHRVAHAAARGGRDPTQQEIDEGVERVPGLKASLQTGKRGGRFYLNASGKKVYLKG